MPLQKKTFICSLNLMLIKQLKNVRLTKSLETPDLEKTLSLDPATLLHTWVRDEQNDQK